MSQGLKKHSRKIEARFLRNLGQKQAYEAGRAAIPATVADDMQAKDIYLEEFEILPNSAIAGKTLQELRFKQQTGVSVITILRGHRKINIPSAGERLYPGDRIVVSGCDEEFLKLKSLLDCGAGAGEYPDEAAQHHINLSQFEVERNSPLAGKTIKALLLRERTETLIVAIERDGRSIVGFTSDFVILAGDTLLIAGEQEKLDTFGDNLV